VIKHTVAYGHFKDETEGFINFVVLVCHAVPTLRRVIDAHQTGTSALVLKPADHFIHDRSTDAALLALASTYQSELARSVVLTTFSYFEEYVKSALSEIVKFHGGDGAFLSLAEKRSRAHMKTPSATVLRAKRKLQEPAKRGKYEKYQKYSEILSGHRFRFPSDVLAAFGVRQLIEKVRKKSRSEMKAYEIPDLLGGALQMDISHAERKEFDDMRSLRNSIAHGSAKGTRMTDSLKAASGLQAWAAKIDQHIVEHFLVLERFAP
jgi:hypothetical protein